MADDKAYREQLQAESLTRFPGTGRKAKLARKKWRNEQRATQGFAAESALPRGGVAGFWDRNKNVAVPIAAGLASLATGGLAAPIALGAVARGLDREGKGGIGFDAGQAARGGLEGAAAGSLATAGKSLAASALKPSAATFANAIPGAPVPVGAVQAVPQVGAEVATQPGVLGRIGNAAQRVGSFARGQSGQNLLGLMQGVNAAYSGYQARQAERRALNESLTPIGVGDLPDRQALAGQMFDQFARSTEPAYEATLRQANRFGAANGMLNSGALRTEFGNLANQRNQQLDLAREGFLTNALEGTIGDAWNRVGLDERNQQRRIGGREREAAARRGQAGQAGQALGDFWRTIGRQTTPQTPPINPNAPVVLP